LASVSGSGAAITGGPTTITVTDSAPPPPVGQCPSGFTPPADLLQPVLPSGFGNPLYQMQRSGQIVAMPLPATGLASGSVSFGESAGGAYTPQPVMVEISINKCPGLIEPVADNAGRPQYCNRRSNNGSYNSVTWVTRPIEGVVVDIDSANRYLAACWAGDAGAQYYINARWTYGSCAFGAQICGFGIQHNRGPY
jgi:hypothetical protein